MNILFFLTPKAMCAYIEAGDTLRQAMERIRAANTAASSPRAICCGRSSACA